MENKKLIIGVTEQSVSVICYKVNTRVELLACQIYAQKEFTKKLLQRFLEEHDAHQIDTQVILGPQLYRILMVDRPNIKDEELTQAAKWLAKDLITDNLEDVVVDAFPTVERVSKTNKLYMVIANKSYLQSLYELCFMAGAHLTTLTIAEIGFLQLVPDSSQVNVIVYSPEENEVRVLIVYNGEIDFIRNIKIKNTLIQENNLRCEELALELNRSIDFYATQFGDAVKEILYVPCEFFSEDYVNLLKNKMTIDVAVLYDNNFSKFLGDSRWDKHIMAFGLIPNIITENKNDAKN